MIVYLEAGTGWALTVPGRAAGSLLEPGKVVTVFGFPLPSWGAALVSCPDGFVTACVCNWTSCSDAFGGFWVVSIAGRVGVGRFVATPLDTSRTRPSSKVVIGVPRLTKGKVSRSRRNEGGFFRFEPWFAESSGVAGGGDPDDTDTGLPGASAGTDSGCIARLTATSWRGQGETAKGRRKRRKR